MAFLTTPTPPPPQNTHTKEKEKEKKKKKSLTWLMDYIYVCTKPTRFLFFIAQTPYTRD